MKVNRKKLSILKQGRTVYPTIPDNAVLETFDNPSLSNDYFVEFETEEFTSLCPVTKQPDFAKIIISYVPAQKCIESKSLKLYLYSFRNYSGFAEKIINRILDDIVDACKPLEAEVTGYFSPRGGITIKVTANYKKESSK